MAEWTRQDQNIVDLQDLTALNLVPSIIKVHYKKEYDPILEPIIVKYCYEVKTLNDNQLFLVQNNLTELITIAQK